MASRFLRPTKYKLILFVILTALIFFLPVVPTLTAPVVLNPTYTWSLKSPAESWRSIEIIGVSEMYFGTFTGADAFLVSIAATLMISYLVSCILVYIFKRERKEEDKRTGKVNPLLPRHK